MKPLVPLCVDLDGTLIRSDLLLESLVLLIKRNPLYMFLLPLWLLRGKAALKANIARRVTLNPAGLPYNAELLAWLRKEKDAGRSLWLCTASNRVLVEPVADHPAVFDGIIASDETTNLSGAAKATRLVARFGDRNFDYCGNNKVDLAVWRHSHAAIVVSGNPSLLRQAKAVADIARTFAVSSNFWRSILTALRAHQWVKNFLLFVPLAAAHRIGDPTRLWAAALAFIAFGLCASSVYLLNDMLDLESDRQNPRKHKRPFASGDLSLLVGFALVPLLLLSAFAVTLVLPQQFFLALAGYYVLTVAYSFVLKRRVLVDTLSLAGLYTARIVAGAAAVAVPLSFWLLLFSVFLFLSLAMVKRYAELECLRREGKLSAAGRGYRIEDLPVLQTLGGAAGYLSVLVLALYINGPAVAGLYRQPKAIWFLCVLMLYWISRIWMKAHRGEMLDDPVVFVLCDRISLGIGALAAVTIAVAI